MYELLGYTISKIGDFNNDGYSDIFLSGNTSIYNQSYLIYGREKFDVDFNLHNLSGNYGITLYGNITDVSSAGDFNNDGYDDIIVAYNSENGTSGTCNLIYGGIHSCEIILENFNPYSSKNQFNIFPNPAANFIQFEFNEIQFNDKMSVELFDLNGKFNSNYTYEIQSNTVLIDVQNLEKGIYVVRLSNGSNRIASKFVKQ